MAEQQKQGKLLPDFAEFSDTHYDTSCVADPATDPRLRKREAAQLIQEEMETPELKAQPDLAESAQSTPRRKVDSKPVPTDSLVSIPLTDSSLSRPATVDIENGIVETPRSSVSPTEYHRSTISSDRSVDDKRSTTSEPEEQPSLAEEIASSPEKQLSLLIAGGRSRSCSTTSEASLQVDWEQLDKTEATQEEEADDEEAVCIGCLESSYNTDSFHSKRPCFLHA